ncbi:MAG TPA: histidine phosphatase family protein [Polyangiales bacterium]|nr:histidine phosphatase family protein [Polyangiales bacterium]
MTLLHLIRHGRASALEADYDQLQPLGELQARLLGEHLRRRRQHFDAVYVGPLRRQLETLRIMREAALEVGSAWPEATVLDGLAEGPFEPLMKNHVRPRLPQDPQLQVIVQALRGAADARTRDEALNTLFDYMVGLWRTGAVVAEELESPTVFQARVLDALERIAQREGQGREVAVVTSNGVIGALLQDAGLAPANGSMRHRLYNSSVSLLELNVDRRGIARGCNSIEHLSDPDHLTLI